MASNDRDRNHQTVEHSEEDYVRGGRAARTTSEDRESTRPPHRMRLLSGGAHRRHG
jgi:hypothetical protein